LCYFRNNVIVGVFALRTSLRISNQSRLRYTNKEDTICSPVYLQNDSTQRDEIFEIQTYSMVPTTRRNAQLQMYNDAARTSKSQETKNEMPSTATFSEGPESAMIDKVQSKGSSLDESVPLTGTTNHAAGQVTEGTFVLDGHQDTEATPERVGKRRVSCICTQDQDDSVSEGSRQKRMCLDEGLRGMTLRTIPAQALDSAQLSLPPPSDADRRPSWEMDGVQHGDWNNLKPGDEKSVLRRLELPPEAATEMRQFGKRAHITPNIQNLAHLRQRAPLYHDVEGRIPAGHEALTEQDAYNVPYGPLEHEREMQRGLQLSRMPIANAPPWTKDLPWDDMDGITLEEFIIYFPNHVARWPGLALWLRHQSWDRLFYRTARLINLARGSHYAVNRERQHVEVLPLMMKVQRAVQEMVPHYQLADHDSYDEQPTKEWFLQHIRDKPVNFPRDGIMGTVTLEEAAGYITGVNGFQERAFSAKMWGLQPGEKAKLKSNVLKKRREEAKFPFAGAFDDVCSTVQTQSPPHEEQYQAQAVQRAWHDVDNSRMGWIDTELNMPVTLNGNSILPRDGQFNFITPPAVNTHPNNNPTSTVNSTHSNVALLKPATSIFDRCPLFDDCEDFDCPFEHARNVKEREKEAALSAFQTEERKNLNKKNVICNQLPTCTDGFKCKFLHVGDEGYMQALVDRDATQLSRKNGGEGSSGPRQQGQGGQSDGGGQQHGEHKQVGQQQQQQQRNQNSQQQQNKDRSNTQRQNGTQPRPPRAPCRHGVNCNNATCPFGHRSPAADESATVNLEQTCRFGVGCTNSRCDRTHPSPASAGQGQGGSGAQSGDVEGQSQGGGRSRRGGHGGQVRGIGNGDGSNRNPGADHGENQTRGGNQNHGGNGNNKNGHQNGGRQQNGINNRGLGQRANEGGRFGHHSGNGRGGGGQG